MDDEHCYRAASSRDGRFDGAFVTAVTTTRIYCRPSCPAMTPKRNHMRFYPTPAAAQNAGFRACKRCRPDAAPGSPEWNIRADVVARAVRLIGDGVVEREGVSGLARRLGYSVRHLDRLVVAELGTGPLQLALAHRVQSARTLLETTELPVSDVAWAAGFGSIRQFNDRIHEAYDLSPRELRRRGQTGAIGPSGADPAGSITVNLSFRPPLALQALLDFIGQRAIPGVESYDGTSYSRVLRLPHGLGVASVGADGTAGPTHQRRRARPAVTCRLRLQDMRDFAAAVSRLRRLLDLDADPEAVSAALSRSHALAPLVARRPGLRVPGAVDGPEMALRAVLGQQVSVPAARTLGARLAAQFGEPLPEPIGPLARAFPSAEAIAAADPAELPLPVSRARALLSIASAVAEGRLCLDPGADRDEAESRLLAVPGIGTWTASYVRMRGLGDPDIFLPSDLGVQKALALLPDRGPQGADPDGWRPWRSYATFHIWGLLKAETPVLFPQTKQGATQP
jgi:AraC family transcriptional regulator, regulatory protein of adaptative response / DNA-3-methyladenine glycosylase II